MKIFILYISSLIIICSLLVSSHIEVQKLKREVREISAVQSTQQTSIPETADIIIPFIYSPRNDPWTGTMMNALVDHLMWQLSIALPGAEIIPPNVKHIQSTSAPATDDVQIDTRTLKISTTNLSHNPMEMYDIETMIDAARKATRDSAVLSE